MNPEPIIPKERSELISSLKQLASDLENPEYNLTGTDIEVITGQLHTEWVRTDIKNFMDLQGKLMGYRCRSGIVILGSGRPPENQTEFRVPDWQEPNSLTVFSDEITKEEVQRLKELWMQAPVILVPPFVPEVKETLKYPAPDLADIRVQEIPKEPKQKKFKDARGHGRDYKYHR